MIKLGLTGSIGMGKSTTAQMFRDAGIPVHDADAAVHRIYSGPAVESVEKQFPGSTREGTVDRAELSRQLMRNPAKFAELEAIIHPLVHAEEAAFLVEAAAAGHDLVVLDIPLLFEKGGESRVDVIAVVSCPAEMQRQRVLARPGMTEEKFELILSRQTPDSAKRERADFIIETGNGLEAARAQVNQIIDELKKRAQEKAR